MKTTLPIKPGFAAPRRPVWLTVAIVAWATAIVGGTLAMAHHDATPGEPARPAGGVAVGPAATLTLVVRPDCPCSAASVAQLETLASRSGGRLAMTVLFVEDRGEDATRSALWRDATRIAGVRAVQDPLGLEAGRLGARTSGQAFVYDAAGRLLFSGGLTPSRGHVGASEGVALVASLVDGTATPRSSTRPAEAPVYGCALR